MARGRKQQLYWDKTNKSYFQYLIKNGKRKKVYLCTATSRTNDPKNRAKALKKWREIQEQHGLTPYQIRKRRDLRKKNLDDTRDYKNRRSVNSVAGIIDHFLYFQFTRFKDKQIGQNTFINSRSNINYFAKWLASKIYDLASDKSGGPTELLTKQRLRFYWEHLVDYVARGKMKKNYAAGLFKTAKELDICIKHNRLFLSEVGIISIEG